MKYITIQFLFEFFIIFTRLASLIYFLPALGDERITLKGKLSLALFTSLLAVPILSDYLPEYTTSSSQLVYYIFSEMLLGTMIGISVKITFTSIMVLGNLISMQSGLSAASIFDPSQKEQIMLFSSFISMFTLVAIFASDTHHYFIAGFFETYSKFQPGNMIDLGDASNNISRIVGDSFLLAFKISSPFLILGLAIMTASGVLSRLMPTLQVLFVVTPAQIFVMFCVMIVVIQNVISLIIEHIKMIF